MTRADAAENVIKCLAAEKWSEAGVWKISSASAEILREIRESKLATANALDVLASFAIEGEAT